MARNPKVIRKATKKITRLREKSYEEGLNSREAKEFWALGWVMNRFYDPATYKVNHK
jgi:hypothetical protein